MITHSDRYSRLTTVYNKSFILKVAAFISPHVTSCWRHCGLCIIAVVTLLRYNYRKIAKCRTDVWTTSKRTLFITVDWAWLTLNLVFKNWSCSFINCLFCPALTARWTAARRFFFLLRIQLKLFAKRRVFGFKDRLHSQKHWDIDWVMKHKYFTARSQ